MSMFLLTAVPLFFFLFMSIDFSGIIATKNFRTAFILGCGISFFSLLLLSIIHYYITIRYSWLTLFFYHWFFNVFFFTLVSVTESAVLVGKRLLPAYDRKDFPFVYAFFSGYFTPVSFYILIQKFYMLDFFILFLYPLLLITLGFWISFIVLEAFGHQGYLRVLIFSTLIPLTATAALVPEFYYLNFQNYGMLIGLFLFIICFSVYSILRHDYRRVFGT